MELIKGIELLTNMQRIRSLEELSAELYTQEKIRGFLHLYIGQEAIATGVLNFLSLEDNVVGTYREHSHALLKGISAKKIFAEMYGKVEGCSKGRGGSMHLFSKEHRFFGGSAIVASGIPHAVGLPFAAEKLGEKRKTVCFFGEGAMAEGAFHEAMNMASLWKIPLLFCCENNLYAMGTALKKSQAQLDFVKKSESYLIKAEKADGMNIMDVFEKTKYALDYMESEQRPFFLEFQTYRFKPHSMYDPDLYRDKNEIALWKEKDPIVFLKKHLLSLLSVEEKNSFLNNWERINIEILKEMQEAIVFAENGRLENFLELQI